MIFLQRIFVAIAIALADDTRARQADSNHSMQKIIIGGIVVETKAETPGRVVVHGVDAARCPAACASLKLKYGSSMLDTRFRGFVRTEWLCCADVAETMEGSYYIGKSMEAIKGP